jgi:hypothetical protein
MRTLSNTVFYLVAPCVLFFSSCTNQKTITNTSEIKKHIIWSDWKTTSVRDGNIIYPSYEITVEKLTDKEIYLLQFRIDWYYGQDWDYIKSKEFTWNRYSPELKILNTQKAYTLKEELYPIKRQDPNTPRSEGKERGYLQPDGEEIYGYEIKLIIEK